MTDKDPKKDDYKNDGFAHTSWNIPKREFDFQAHEWIQEGTQMTCQSCPQPHASPIPVDKMLIKENGEYRIVPIHVLS